MNERKANMKYPELLILSCLLLEVERLVEGGWWRLGGWGAGKQSKHINWWITTQLAFTNVLLLLLLYLLNKYDNGLQLYRLGFEQLLMFQCKFLLKMQNLGTVYVSSPYSK